MLCIKLLLLFLFNSVSNGKPKKQIKNGKSKTGNQKREIKKREYRKNREDKEKK